jgi:hypothetical protein
MFFANLEINLKNQKGNTKKKIVRICNYYNFN